jgi:hypothetical protein
LLTLVLLIVLSAIGYALTAHVAARCHRERYMVDYASARYACDSVIRYSIATLGDINIPPLIVRVDEPDFSDTFAMTEAEYQKFLEDWQVRKALEERYDANRTADANRAVDVNGPNDVNNIGVYAYGISDINSPNSLTVRGPYGPVWPFIIEPVEFEVGSAKIKIEIEDENAKYPLGWVAMDNNGIQREILASFKTFCEWMDVNETDISSMSEQLQQLSKIKSFQLDFKPIETKKEVPQQAAGRHQRGQRGGTTSATTSIPAIAHTTDFARLFHSSLIDTEVLARPTIVSESRKESALKYVGMWGSSRVNINTATRQVLEAAFTFGGDYKEIAEEIIQRRQKKPFESIEDLRKSLLKYSTSIEKCQPYITTTSNFFTIRVTAISGVAKASTIIALIKNGKEVQTVAIMSG